MTGRSPISRLIAPLVRRLAPAPSLVERLVRDETEPLVREPLTRLLKLAEAQG